MLFTETSRRGADHRVWWCGWTDPAQAAGRGGCGARQCRHGPHQARCLFRHRAHVRPSLGEPGSISFRRPVRATHQWRRGPGEPRRQGNAILRAFRPTRSARGRRGGVGAGYPAGRGGDTSEVARSYRRPRMKKSMEWKVRELVAEETHDLRRAVSADGRTDLPSMHHVMDDSPGAVSYTHL